MESTRVFIAIELAEAMTRKLARIQEALKGEIRLPVSWVRPEGIHLTLTFLGEVPLGNLEAIREAMERAASQAAPFSISLGRLGGFPSLQKPRVLWVGVEGDVQALAALQRQLEQSLDPLGFPPHREPFHPHLTLGRVQQIRPLSLPGNPEKLEAGVGRAGIQQEVRSISLVKSELKPGGAVYTRLASAPLS